MLLKLNPADSRPLYLQIASGVRRAIAEGSVDEGDSLPPARALALALDVNMHTVLRAYAELRDADIIEMRRGRGSVIRSGAVSRSNLIRLAGDLISEAQRGGINKRDLIAIIEQEMP